MFLSAMAEKSKKTHKRLIFTRDLLFRLGERAELKPATNLKWEFARAVLRGEPIHLLDGFMIHGSWRQGGQDGSYLALFRTNKANAVTTLRGDLKIKGIRVDRPAKEDLYTWQVHLPAEGFECNITEAVRIAREARQRFSQGDPTGWDLVQRAYSTWPDARSIYQALAFAGPLSERRDRYEDLVAGVRQLLEKYRDDFIHALYRILCLAVENQQGITREIVDDEIAPWVSEFFELKQALNVLSETPPAQHAPVDRAASQFAELLRKYVEQSDYLSELKEKSADEVRIVEHEVAQLLKRLRECDAVVDAAGRLAKHYEDLEYLRIRWNDVSGCLADAIEDFSKQVRNLRLVDSALLARFEVHLHVFVARSRKGQGIRDVLNSDKSRTEKEKEFRRMLENMTEEEEVRDHLRRLFDLNRQEQEKKKIAIPRRPYYLRPAEEVLDIGARAESAEWFRLNGPTAADFADERVYLRTVVDDLRTRIRANPIFMLKGAAATGKTVIVRSLLHELYSDGRRDIYLFDIAPRRNFNEARLGRELEAIEGLCVVENVHLEPRKMQLIYERFKHDKDSHVLFTARHLDGRYEDMFLNSLNKIPSLSLEPRDEVHDIINYFCSHPTTPVVVAERIPQLLDVSAGDYWLLAFALQGCAKAHGAGDPNTWIASEVRRYVENLETSKDPYRDQYPGILLALSPLYMNEVLTAQSYLTDRLGFTKRALDDLAKRGEITRQRTPTGHVFYGLPHSSRARAYWKHGQEYSERKHITGPEDWVLDYAKSNTPNGLTAILSLNRQSVSWIDRPSVALLTELRLSGDLAAVVEREQSVYAVYQWLGDEAFDVDFSLELARMLANKLVTAQDLSMAHACVELLFEQHPEMPAELPILLDSRVVAARLVSADDVKVMRRWIATIRKYKPSYAADMCGHMKPDGLVSSIMGASGAEASWECISEICRANRKVGLDLLSRLERVNFAEKLKSLGNIKLCKCIIELAPMIPGAWDLVQVLSSRLKNDAERSEILGVVIGHRVCDLLSENPAWTHEECTAALNDLCKRLNQAFKGDA
jgi:hypothetical protein